MNQIGVGTQRKVPSDDILLKLIADKNRSLASIARDLGVSDTTITRHARKHGLMRRTTCKSKGKMPSDSMLAYLYIDKGLSSGLLAKEFGVSISTIQNRLGFLGIIRYKGECVWSIYPFGSSKKIEGDTNISKGYSMTYFPDHPRANRKWGVVGTHVLVAERMIGRQLKKGEVVHHIDFDKSNNDPANLFVCKDTSTHIQLHYQAGPMLKQLFKQKMVVFRDGKYVLVAGKG
jgi:hypothetical protein